jgi:hypothetical protein
MVAVPIKAGWILSDNPRAGLPHSSHRPSLTSTYDALLQTYTRYVGRYGCHFSRAAYCP